jgi:hypothetical protein
MTVPYASFADRFDVNEPIDPVTFIKGGSRCGGHAAKRNGISFLVPETSRLRRR